MQAFSALRKDTTHPFGADRQVSHISSAWDGSSPEAQAHAKRRLTKQLRGVRCMLGTLSLPGQEQTDSKLEDSGTAEFDLSSRNLSAEDYVAMRRVHGGCMPHIRLSSTEPDKPLLADRIRELDMDFQSKVQTISNRLRQQKAPPRKAWCRVSLCAGLGKFLKLGIFLEIWSAILVYIVYTVLVQWFVYSLGWDLKWSATNQDSVYYPGLVLSFLLSLRASDCMLRYQAGCQHCFEMERNLRDLAFEVLNNLKFERVRLGKASSILEESSIPQPSESISLEWKKRYFGHEFRRLLQVLFFCAAHDLIDSEPDALTDASQQMECRATDVEHAAICLTHSGYGHVFRVYLVAAWIRKLLSRASDQDLFENPESLKNAEYLLREFTSSWFNARQVAYSRMPIPLRHILWILTNMMALALPWEYVSRLHWYTWPLSVVIVAAFFGVLRMADAMENPFGFDADDIPIWAVAEKLDEEICLTMQLMGLDKVGGENLYRSMFNESHVYKMSVGFPL